MPSDIRPPADHSALFSDAGKLALELDRKADHLFRQAQMLAAEGDQEGALWSDVEAQENQERAKAYRKLAELGEQMPEF